MRLPNGYGGVVKLSGNRRRPYAARITTGWHVEEETGRRIQHYQILGYASDRTEALRLLAQYNDHPIDSAALKLTFRDIYEKWSSEKFPATSDSSIKSYRAAYAVCTDIEEIPFRNLRLNDLQRVIDQCGKNYPTLKKIRVLFNQLYEYALKHEIVYKDYSEFLNIVQYKNRNPNRTNRGRLSREELAGLWQRKGDRNYQTILMLVYSGVRVSELLNLKKENVHLEEQYFDVVDSKTENGIRKVPIADKVLPFYKGWYRDCSHSEYLIHTADSEHFTYHMYYTSVFKPSVHRLGMDCTPHCCRHSCISMLADAHVDQTTIKKIVGHSGAMSLTERVYTHIDIRELINAINLI
ncbi:MAG: tyrosine-type recombinase/integrase [Blautia sp.]|nr:tyrosine-type recombinase/integrase [Blautia sp.]